MTVFGYSDEEYLRIGPNGVWRNANSPATYLDLGRDDDVDLPANAEPRDSSPPQVVADPEPPSAATACWPGCSRQWQNSCTSPKSRALTVRPLSIPRRAARSLRQRRVPVPNPGTETRSAMCDPTSKHGLRRQLTGPSVPQFSL